MVTIFDEALGIGDPEDWKYMRYLNEPCGDCSCCRSVQCAGEEGEYCGEGCPCTSG